ncbi:hypothetical protein ES703_123635 [subsurface metagenome]
MKETGIIMSGDHPRKILDGTKTMSRRTYGLEKINDMPYPSMARSIPGRGTGGSGCRHSRRKGVKYDTLGISNSSIPCRPDGWRPSLAC